MTIFEAMCVGVGKVVLVTAFLAFVFSGFALAFKAAASGHYGGAGLMAGFVVLVVVGITEERVRRGDL